MPPPPKRELPLGDGGVIAELGLSDPRVARRRTQKLRAQGGVRPGAQSEQPAAGDDDRLLSRLVLRKLPGRGDKSRTGRVRVGHRVIVEGQEAFCHSFTITKAAYESLRSGEPLSAKGATLPNGLPVVPDGVDPLTVAVRCASCGAEQVGCQEMLFFGE